MFNIKSTTIILISFAVLSCKTAKDVQSEITTQLPKKFQEQIDSKTTVLPNWNVFFGDSTLTSLINTSLEHNFEVQSAMQRVLQFRFDVVLNKGIRLPDVNFNGIVGQQKFGKYTMDGVGNYDTNFSNNITPNQKMTNPLPQYYLGLNSQWEIDIWGKLNQRKKAAISKFVASEYAKQFVQTQVIENVATLYYELLALDAEKEILIDNIELQEESLNIVIIQKQVGRANELAIEIMRGRQLSSKGRLIELEQKIIVVENQINFLLARYPQSIDRKTHLFQQKQNQLLQEGVPSDLLRNRPDIKQAELELIAAKADVKSARKAFYPSLIINSSVGYQAFNAALLFDPSSLANSVMGGLTAPLLNRRHIKSQLMLSKAEHQLAYINYQKSVITGFTEVYNDLNQLTNVGKMEDLKKQEVAVFKTSIVTSTELFKTGKATYLEIITAQKNYLESQLELIELKKQRLQSNVNLYKSLGGGWQ